MKKSIIVGLILLLVGGLVFSMGFFGSGFDLSAVNGDLGPFAVRFGHRRGFGGEDSSGAYRERRAAYDAADLARLVLREDNAYVTVTASPDDKIHVIWQESTDDPLKHSNDGGVLTLKRQSHFGIFFLFGLWDEDLRTELQLPEGFTGALDVKSDNGSVTAEDVFLRGDAELSSSNGTVTAEGLRAKRVTLKNSNGAIRAENVVCTDAVLKNSNGIIEAGDFACDSLAANASNGRITLTDVSAETSFYAKTSNGAVDVENISAGESIKLHTSNGNIRGTLAGSSDDYRIESKASNGSNNLPNNWGKGSILLTVHTSNGSIDLRFAED